MLTSDTSSWRLDAALDAVERNESARLSLGRRRRGVICRPWDDFLDFIDGCYYITQFKEGKER